MIFKSLLDTDLYKFTMLQPIWRHYRAAQGQTRFLCRTKGVDLRPYTEEIKKELRHLCTLKFTAEEIDYLRDQSYFEEEFLNWLSTFQLKFDQLTFKNSDRLEIEATGPWHEISLFEIYTLSIVNEVYFRNTQAKVDMAIGRSRLLEKIDLLNRANQQAQAEGKQTFKLVDFGTRRRFSAAWQAEVDETLKDKMLQGSFIGTSSVYLAKKVGVKPVGTHAHEWLQAFQRLASSLETSQKEALEVWIKEYHGQLGIALSDIFGTKPFLKDFTYDLASAYQGARHDSGDPIEWGQALINHYKHLGIDPQTKTLVFSDGLDIPRALEIYYEFRDQINLVFGIGTNITNDMGCKALNIVMKLVSINNLPVCKISEEPSKAICDDPEFLAKIRQIFGV